jgi:hypothetical protein
MRQLAVPNLFSSVVWVAATTLGWPQQTSIRPAVPTEPIPAILDAFRTHRVVAIYDAHGNEQTHAFLLSLIRDPRFAAVVNDIVVGVGNSRYQDEVDRFVRGESVSYQTLRLAWLDTTVENVEADLPTHEQLLRTVRAVNSSRPQAPPLRVVLGEPPFDWTEARGPDDVRHARETRPSFTAAAIQVEVLARQRRALLLYPLHQLQRKSIFTNYEMDDWRAQTPVSLIESATPHRIFTIWQASDNLASLQRDVQSWPIPSLALVRGTGLGRLDFADHFWKAPRFTIRGEKPVPVPPSEWRPMPAEEQFDAILYFGPPSTLTQIPLSPTVCTEPGYLQMRLTRLALGGVPRPEVDRLKAHCAKLTP